MKIIGVTFGMQASKVLEAYDDIRKASKAILLFQTENHDESDVKLFKKFSLFKTQMSILGNLLPSHPPPFQILIQNITITLSNGLNKYGQESMLNGNSDWQELL